MKKTIKLRYVDTMSKNYKNEVLWKLLTEWYIIDEMSEPDYIIHGGMGTDFTKYSNAVRIQIVGENIVPDFNVFDYAIGFDHMQFGDRYIRVPLYVFYDAYQKVVNETQALSKEIACGRKFCCFIVSNARYADPIRDFFFHELSKYKRVDSAGRHLNNIGGGFLKDKLEFVSQYKFNIAFENCASEGYTTEKIMEPMSVNTLPIYWGNPTVYKDFNTKSFINLADFKTIEDCINYIKILDSNDELYFETLQQPWIIRDGTCDYYITLKTFFDNIFAKYPKSKRINQYGRQSVFSHGLDNFYKIQYKLEVIEQRLKSLMLKLQSKYVHF